MAKAKTRVNAFRGDISSDLFRIAAMFVARGGLCGRSALGGVRIEPHPERGVVLIATDGRRMIALHDCRGRINRPVTLAYAGVKACPKLEPGRENRWRIRGGAGTRRAGETAVAILPEPYPDYLVVMRAACTPQAATTCVPREFNRKYMADFARAAAMLQAGDDPARIVLLPGKDRLDPIIILFPCAPHACGLLMPMLGTHNGQLPKFISSMLRRRAKKKERRHARTTRRG